MYNVRYIKIDHISNTKSRTKKTAELKNPFQITFEQFFFWLVTHKPDSETLTTDTREPVSYGDSIQKHTGLGGKALQASGGDAPQKNGP